MHSPFSLKRACTEEFSYAKKLKKYNALAKVLCTNPSTREASKASVFPSSKRNNHYTALDSKSSEVQQTPDQVQKLLKDLPSCITQQQELDSEINQIEAQLDETLSRKLERQAKNQELTLKGEELQKDKENSANNHASEIKKLEEELANISRQRQTHQTQLSVLEESNTKLKSQIINAESQLRALESEVESLQQEKLGIETQNQKLESGNSETILDIRHTLSSLEEIIEQHNDDLENKRILEAQIGAFTSKN